MQLSTPTASFDSGPLANLLAPGAPAPTAATSLPTTPFADFMPVDVPSTPAAVAATAVPVAMVPTPAVAFDGFPAPEDAPEFSPELGGPWSPQPLAGSAVPVPSATRPLAVTLAAACPAVLAAGAPIPAAPLEFPADAASVEPLETGEASTPADARPTDLRPRHRPAALAARLVRTVEVKSSRSDESAPAPAPMAPLPQPLAPEVLLNFVTPFAPNPPSTTPIEETAADEDTVGCATPAANEQRLALQFASGDSRVGESHVARVNAESPTVVTAPVASTGPSAPSDRVAVPTIPSTADFGAASRQAKPTGRSPVVMTTAAEPPSATNAENLPAPLPAGATPVARAGFRPGNEAIPKLAPADEGTDPVAVTTPEQPLRPVWSSYGTQPLSTSGANPDLLGAQPILRTRNVSMVSSTAARPDSTPLNPAVRTGESITTALPTLASMLPPKSASAPFVGSTTPEVGQGAKTAAGSADFSADLISGFEADQLNFLTPAQQQVKMPVSELGIAVAKSPPAMPAATSNRRSTAPVAAAPELAVPTAPHLEMERALPNPAAVSFVAPTLAPAPVAPPPPATGDQPATLPATPAQVSAAAHRAVDAVLASTDRFTPVTQSSVDLQLSVGDAPLSVRVEVRAGVVHATFRTDSPELRTALAQEWQAAGHQQSADQSLRLAPPVFANSDRSSGDAGSALSGQNFSQARDQSARSAPEFFPAGTARSQLSAALTAEPAAAPAPSRRSTADSSARLHAFA